MFACVSEQNSTAVLTCSITNLLSCSSSGYNACIRQVSSFIYLYDCVANFHLIFLLSHLPSALKVRFSYALFGLYHAYDFKMISIIQTICIYMFSVLMDLSKQKIQHCDYTALNNSIAYFLWDMIYRMKLSLDIPTITLQLRIYQFDEQKYSLDSFNNQTF